MELITWLAWLAATVRERLGRKKPAELREPDPRTPAKQHDQGRDVAQLEDHGRPAARPADPPTPDTDRVAVLLDPGRDDGSGPLRVLLKRRIDGGTSWALESAGKRPWLIWNEIKRAASRGERLLDVVDRDGEVVEYALDRGKPGSGKLVLRSGSTRVDIRKNWAEITIRAEAAEVEGVEAWARRELPRIVGWLTSRALAFDELGEAGLEQRRIEQCLDLGGLLLVPGIEQGMVSKASKWNRWLDEHAGRRGFGAGNRDSTPNSIGVYDKPAELRAQRGPEHAALLARLREAGWFDARCDDHGPVQKTVDDKCPTCGGEVVLDEEPIARIELRCWGEALLLEGVDGRTYDATHYAAALDGELLDVLWADGLQRHRLVDPRPAFRERVSAWIRAGRPKKKRPRLRDEPDHPAWSIAQAAAGEPVRLRRDLQARQRAAVHKHALGRLARVGADVEDLEGGTGDGEAAIEALRRAAREPDWAGLVGRARAKHRDLQ